MVLFNQYLNDSIFQVLEEGCSKLSHPQSSFEDGHMYYFKSESNSGFKIGLKLQSYVKDDCRG